RRRAELELARADAAIAVDVEPEHGLQIGRADAPAAGQDVAAELEGEVARADRVRAGGARRERPDHTGDEADETGEEADRGQSSRHAARAEGQAGARGGEGRPGANHSKTSLRKKAGGRCGKISNGMTSSKSRPCRSTVTTRALCAPGARPLGMRACQRWGERVVSRSASSGRGSLVLREPRYSSKPCARGLPEVLRTAKRETYSHRSTAEGTKTRARPPPRRAGRAPCARAGLRRTARTRPSPGSRSRRWPRGTRRRRGRRR